MFNLLVKAGANAWSESPVFLPKDRVGIEFTVYEIRERYKVFDKKTIAELKSLPTIFVCEEETPSIGLHYRHKNPKQGYQNLF